MEVTFAPKGILQIDNARITHRNFAGEGSPYNREGDRNFSLIIGDEELYNRLKAEGWNVKKKDPYDDSDIPFMFLPVKVKFNERGPDVYLASGRAKRKLSEDTIGILDNMDIETVNLDIRPFDWTLANGNSGRTAYLHSMEVIQRISRFASRYEDEE